MKYVASTQEQWIRSDLENVKDIEFLGNIYIGTPHSQLAKVVFDTGSDWLTIKSCLTEAHCHKTMVQKDDDSKGEMQTDTVYYMN